MKPAVEYSLMQALKFSVPALQFVISKLDPGSTSAFIADILLRVVQRALDAASSGGTVMFSAAGVPLPPEHEWTEEGIARWAEAQARPDDAA
jgi:hypothetical protein